MFQADPILRAQFQSAALAADLRSIYPYGLKVMPDLVRSAQSEFVRQLARKGRILCVQAQLADQASDEFRKA